MGIQLSRQDVLIINSKESIKKLTLFVKKIIFEIPFEIDLKFLLRDNLNIETIQIKYIYKFKIEYLPSNLKNLDLSIYFNENIENLSENLECLTCSDIFLINQKNIPINLKKLIIIESFFEFENDCDYDFKNIIKQRNLEKLSFYNNSKFKPNDNFLEKYKILFDNLPNTIKILKIPDFYNLPLLNLPIFLEELHLGINFNQNLDNLPESIKHIGFSKLSNYNKPLFNLPSQLEYLNLEFKNKYCHSIKNLPDSIKFLELGEYELKIYKLPEKIIKLSIYGPVKFKIETKKFDNNHEQLYELLYIGKYNIENKFYIKIPIHLSQITCIDNNSNVINYKKNTNNNYWLKEE